MPWYVVLYTAPAVTVTEYDVGYVEAGVRLSLECSTSVLSILPLPSAIHVNCKACAVSCIVLIDKYK